MINNRRRIIVIISIIIVLIGIILVVIIKNSSDKIKELSETQIENNEANSDIVVDEVTFSDIKKVYEGGITTLSAQMLNNTDTTKNFVVEIILKDDYEKEVKSIIQVIENLEPNKKKVLTTGIAGDYSYIKNIEFKVTENE